MSDIEDGEEVEMLMLRMDDAIVHLAEIHDREDVVITETVRPRAFSASRRGESWLFLIFNTGCISRGYYRLNEEVVCDPLPLVPTQVDEADMARIKRRQVRLFTGDERDGHADEGATIRWVVAVYTVDEAETAQFGACQQLHLEMK